MSRKIKESCSRNDTTLDDIKAVINGMFDEVSEKLDSIEKKFDNTTKEIYLKLENIEKDTEVSRIKTSKNSNETKGLNFQISDQNKQISKQSETKSELESEIEELKNRSLRKTLIFKKIKHQANKGTKKVLIDKISKVLTEASKVEIATNIERAHQVRSSETTGKRCNNTPPYLAAKIANWEFSERIKSAFIVENQNGNCRVFVSQMYSKSLILRQNQTLKHQYELKGDPSIQGYVRYPATKYRVEKECRSFALSLIPLGALRIF